MVTAFGDLPMIVKKLNGNDVRLRYLKDRTGVLQVIDEIGVVGGVALAGRKPWSSMETAKQVMVAALKKFAAGECDRQNFRQCIDILRSELDLVPDA